MPIVPGFFYKSYVGLRRGLHKRRINALLYGGSGVWICILLQHCCADVYITESPLSDHKKRRKGEAWAGLYREIVDIPWGKFFLGSLKKWRTIENASGAFYVRRLNVKVSNKFFKSILLCAYFRWGVFVFNSLFWGKSWETWHVDCTPKCVPQPSSIHLLGAVFV